MSEETRHALVLCSLIASAVVFVLTGHEQEAGLSAVAMLWYFLLGMP